jgi:polysaccharide deacetylase family protein (PEP-CTERM system associated)
MSAAGDKIYLFSIDLEDVRLWMPGGEKYKERVPANTHAYMSWLNGHGFKCTFFTVGEVAQKYPSLIKEILDEGHEIACHTNKHIPLDKQDPASFKKDLEENIRWLREAGAGDIKGFRAPIFSLTEKTKWAFDVLTELGFSYSSSVLPAKSPLYGWPEFGQTPKRVNSSLVEIPMTVGKTGPVTAPYGGGIYFRVFPFFTIMSKVKRHTTASNPLLGYFHPYDIDTGQEHFMHPGINNSKLYNHLMYMNRSKVFERMDRLIDKGFTICTYQQYISDHLIPQ